jgi:hypothetical protein
MPSELREALTAAGASALLAKVIDPTLVELQRRYAPLCRAIPTVKWDTDIYNFNQRPTVPNGGYVPDGGARQVSNSVYQQLGFQMKHVESVGAITGYAQEVTRLVISDLKSTEIRGAILGYYWDIETGICWGNSASTLNQAQPQWDGLDTQINTFSGGTQNVIDKAGNSLTLAFLDELIDMVESNAAMPVEDDSWMFLTSSTGKSKISQLLQNQQRFVDKVEIAPGLICATYREIPFMKSSFMAMRGYNVGTVTAGTATTGGSLPASTTYKYQVSAVIARQGEIAPSVEVSQATGSGTATNTITLSFTPPSGQDGLAPQLYKVWRTAAAGASGSETFLGYVDSTVGLAADNVTQIITNQIVDTGTSLVPQNSTGPVVPSTLPVQYYGTNTAMLPPAAGQENIYLISRDKGNVVRPWVREAQPLDVYPTTASPDTLPYAVIGDTTFAVRATKFLGRAYRVGVSV